MEGDGPHDLDKLISSCLTDGVDALVMLAQLLAGLVRNQKQWHGTKVKAYAAKSRPTSNMSAKCLTMCCVMLLPADAVVVHHSKP